MASQNSLHGRRLARAQALQVLFQAEMVRRPVVAILNESPIVTDGPVMDYADKLVKETDRNKAEINKLIADASHNWNMDRIANVDRNLLRLAVCEILFISEVDTSVAINEAVELAKVFGTDDSPKFVNGMLGAISRGLENKYANLLDVSDVALDDEQDELSHE